jgi:predicted PurR-regulated permease PerM
MLQFLQPAATLFVGLAMFVYGVIQSLLHRPPFAAFQAAAQALPDAVAVLIFVCGLVAIMAGVVLLVSGIRGVRRRAREINHTYGHPHPRPRNPGTRPSSHPDDGYDDEGWDNPVAYR